jgi:hypothetical protein
MGKKFPHFTRRNPMKDSTVTGKKIQEQIKRFAFKLTKTMSKPKKRFITQVLFGIQAARDIKLSNIARSLNEEIKLIKTENRLSRNMSDKDLTERINNILVDDGASRIKEDTVIALDLSDINKPFAKKMENLAEVWNGSEGKVCPGYWVCEAIGVEVNGESPIPLYSELYSHEADGFESENEQILKAIRTVSKKTKKRGVWTMDRGADRRILIGELAKEGLKFVIRSKGVRHVINRAGREVSIWEIVNRMKYKEKYTVEIDQEGYTERIELELAEREKVRINDVSVRIVAVRGFGKKPMILLTNLNNKPMQEILEIYLTRWKCEESFRFLKHEYHLEDVRVRSYTGLRNTVVLIHAVYYFLSVHLGQRLRLQILLSKILEKAKRFFGIPSFKHYAVADGIFRLLFNMKWDPAGEKEEEEEKRQLLFGFT